MSAIFQTRMAKKTAYREKRRNQNEFRIALSVALHQARQSNVKRLRRRVSIPLCCFKVCLRILLPVPASVSKHTAAVIRILGFTVAIAIPKMCCCRQNQTDWPNRKSRLFVKPRTRKNEFPAPDNRCFRLVLKRIKAGLFQGLPLRQVCVRFAV